MANSQVRAQGARVLPLLALMLAMSAACWQSPAGADVEPASSRSQGSFSTSSSAWDGYVEFVRLAQERFGRDRVVLTARLDYSELSDQDAVIVVHPLHRLDESSLSAFLVQGGRLGVLDDFGRGDEFLDNFGIRRRPPPADPFEMLHDNPDLPLAVPSMQVTPRAERGRHPMTADIDRVVANHPRIFEHPNLTTVLEIVDRKGTAHALMVTGVIAQKGRLVALGDPSVFINFMLRYPDNRRLAQALVAYMMEPRATEPAPASSTTKPSRLYIVVGDFAQTGHFGKGSGLRAKLDHAIEESLAALSRFEEDGLTREMALAISAMMAIWIFSTLIGRQLKTMRFAAPSFSRAPVLAQQLGPASRVSILGAKDTDPTLAVMELDALVKEAVARRLHFEVDAHPKGIARVAEARGMSREDAEALEGWLSETRSHGERLARKKRSKVDEFELGRLHRQAMHLLQAIETNKMNQGKLDA